VKIGYASINTTIDRRVGKSFVIFSRKKERVLEDAKANLDELMRILEYNVGHNLLFFRIRPDLIPMASDPKLALNWQNDFGEDLKRIGSYINEHKIRINIHPDLFTMLNHPDPVQLSGAIRDLYYNAELLDLLGLDSSAKIQVHAGERFKHDKQWSIDSFIERFNVLDDRIKQRLVIENENVLCTFRDCMDIHIRTGLPIVPDVLHHEIAQNGEEVHRVLELAQDTWGECDGPMMVDYSSQDPGRMTGKHAISLDPAHFKKFIHVTTDMDFDLMVEHKDRENSAVRVYETIKDDPRVIAGLTSPTSTCQ